MSTAARHGETCRDELLAIPSRAATLCVVVRLVVAAGWPLRPAAKEQTLSPIRARATWQRPVEHGTFTPNAMLVAVDCSRTSLRAVDYAAGQARRNAVGLVGAYVRRHSSLSVCVPGLWGYCAAVEDEI